MLTRKKKKKGRDCVPSKKNNSKVLGLEGWKERVLGLEDQPSSNKGINDEQRLRGSKDPTFQNFVNMLRNLIFIPVTIEWHWMILCTHWKFGTCWKGYIYYFIFPYGFTYTEYYLNLIVLTLRLSTSVFIFIAHICICYRHNVCVSSPPHIRVEIPTPKW